MLIEYTDKDIDRRDELSQKYGNVSPSSWLRADDYEDALDLFEKFERDDDEIIEFNKKWAGLDEDEEDFDDTYDADEYEDDEEDW